MIKNFLNSLLVTAFTLSCSQATDFKGLELEANAFKEKIWNRVPINENLIKESLSFVRNEKLIEKDEDSISKKFQNLIQKAQQIEGLKDFSFMCNSLYDEETESHKRVAIYMLLEKVSNLYERDLVHMKKVQMSSKKESPRSSQESLNLFFNADRNFIKNKKK